MAAKFEKNESVLAQPKEGQAENHILKQTLDGKLDPNGKHGQDAVNEVNKLGRTAGLKEGYAAIGVSGEGTNERLMVINKDDPDHVYLVDPNTGKITERLNKVKNAEGKTTGLIKDFGFNAGKQEAGKPDPDLLSGKDNPKDGKPHTNEKGLTTVYATGDGQTAWSYHMKPGAHTPDYLRTEVPVKLEHPPGTIINSVCEYVPDPNKPGQFVSHVHFTDTKGTVLSTEQLQEMQKQNPDNRRLMHTSQTSFTISINEKGEPTITGNPLPAAGAVDQWGMPNKETTFRANGNVESRDYQDHRVKWSARGKDDWKVVD